MVMAGLMRAARSAGIQHAPTPIAAITNATTANVAGSFGVALELRVEVSSSSQTEQVVAKASITPALGNDIVRFSRIPWWLAVPAFLAVVIALAAAARQLRSPSPVRALLQPLAQMGHQFACDSHEPQTSPPETSRRIECLVVMTRGGRAP